MSYTKKLIFILILIYSLTGQRSNCFANNTGNKQLTKESELFFIAQKAFDDGFYDVAIRYINQLLREYPHPEKYIQANLLLGQCYFFKNQYLKAFEIFQSILKYSEFKDATLFWLGETYLKGADYAQAEKNYKQLISLYPESIYTPQAKYSLSWAFFQQGKYEPAINTFQELINSYPEHELVEDSLFKIGESYFRKKDFNNSINIFKEYINNFPNATNKKEGIFFIAESYYYQSDYANAIEYYNETKNTSLDPNLTLMSKISIGWSYLKLKQFTNAEKAFNEAKVYSNKKGMLADDIYLGQANLFSETKRYQESIETYSRLISDFPNNARIAEAHLGKANIYYLLKNYSKAIKEYKSIIDGFSEKDSHVEIVEKAFFGLAWTYLKMGDIDQSINHFYKIIDQTESKIIKASALTQIGDAYQDKGDLEKALKIYDKILQEFPDSLYADYVQYRQGIALLKSNNIEAATISFQTLQTNFPESKHLKEAQYYLGVAYFKKGSWASAAQYAEGFIESDQVLKEFLPEAHYILALAQSNLSEHNLALKTFQTIIKLFHEHDAIVKNAELGVARSYFHLGQDNEALKRFKIIIYKYPQSEIAQDALLWLANYYAENFKLDLGIKYYMQFINDFPGSKKFDFARYELGRVYQSKGSLEKALNQFKMINNPQNKKIYTQAKLAIGDIFSSDVDSDTALESYKSIAESAPEFKRDSLVKIAQTYQNRSENDKATKTYYEALNADIGLSDISNAEIQFYIADSFEFINQTDKAIEEYLKIPYLYSYDTLWIVKAYLRIGRIFERKEEWEKATITYEKVIKYNTEEAKFAQEKLEKIRQYLE